MNFVNLNASFDQLKWVDKQCYFLKQVFLPGVFILCFDVLIKFFLKCPRNNVPSLSLANVVVVD